MEDVLNRLKASTDEERIYYTLSETSFYKDHRKFPVLYVPPGKFHNKTALITITSKREPTIEELELLQSVLISGEEILLMYTYRFRVKTIDISYKFRNDTPIASDFPRDKKRSIPYYMRRENSQ
jgi:hypothetical protein